jgi:taurine dioxygenase
VPEVGGDTMFANLYLALETLTPPIRRLIEDLEALHDVTLVRGIEQRDPTVVAEMKKRNPPVIHPVVRTHPETGRKSLLVNQRIRRFLGMSDEESQNLLSMLNAHATSPEFVYRQQWRNNDIVVWDNRCTMHQALGDFDETQRRHMERTTVLGTPSGYAVMGG